MVAASDIRAVCHLVRFAHSPCGLRQRPGRSAGAFFGSSRYRAKRFAQTRQRKLVYALKLGTQ
jgi:hypothetical protein